MPDRYEFTDDWLEALLSELGDNPDEIAQTLRAAEIKGRRGEPRDCPIARYVAARVREHEPAAPVTVTVYRSQLAVLVGTPGTQDAREIDAVPPEPVRDFVEAFDQPAHPHYARYADLALPATE